MRFATCLLASLLLLCACGERTVPTKPAVALNKLVLELSILADKPEEQDRVLDEIAALGREDVPAAVEELLELLRRERRVPGREVIEYRVDYGDTGLLRKDMVRDLNTVHATVLRRIKAHYPDFGTTFDIIGVDDASIGRIQMKVLYSLEKSPEEVRPFVDRLAQIGSRRGTFGLRLVVERPREDKPSLFEGSAEQYDKLLAGLREQLESETQAGRNGPVGTPPYLLHLAPPPRAGEPPTDLLLRAPSEIKTRFHQRDMELSGFMDRDKGRHILQFAISKDRQADWTAFCEAHAGRSYALLVNGVVQVNASVPTDSVRREYFLDMGDMRDRVIGGNIVGILRDTMLGWHRRAVTATILPQAPAVVDTPVGMARGMLGEQA